MVATTIVHPALPSCSSGDDSRGRFRFRRYREEFALRQQQRQQQQEIDVHDDDDDVTHDNDENDARAAAAAAATTDTNDASTAKSRTATNENDDDDGGTVLQNLFGALVVIDECGRVSIETNSSSTNNNNNNNNTTSIGTTINSNNEPNNNTKEGSVTENDTTKGSDFPSVVPEGTTLLLRNLRDCRVAIRLPLPAVHFVGIQNTEIDFFNSSSSKAKTIANTTIHATDCHEQSILRLEKPAQQMRIHESVGLGIVVAMMERHAGTSTRPFTAAATVSQRSTPVPSTDTSHWQWKPGSIIMETSRDVCFYVPPLDNAATGNASRLQLEPQPSREQETSLGDVTTAATRTITSSTKAYWHQVIVKDFQWLRKGIPSPNFRIEVFEASSSYGGEDEKRDSTKALERARSATDETEDGNDSDDSDDEL